MFRMEISSRALGQQVRVLLTTSVIFSLMFAGVIGLLPGTADAATGEGTATIRIAVDSGSQNASTATYGSAGATVAATVGALSYLRIDLTVGASHIAAAQNNVTVQIPTNLFPANGFDTDEEATLAAVNATGEFFIAYTDTDAVTTNNGAISFAASAAANTGLITIQANQQMDSTDIISIYAAINDPNYVRSAQNVTIAVDDTGGNSLTNIAVLPTVSTAAANAGASVALGLNSTLFVTGTTTVTLTTPFALDANDTIDITFPTGIDISAVDAAVTGTFEASDSITCAAASQVLTCTTSAATNATGTIILTGIKSLIAMTTDITVFEVEDEGNASNDIATDATVALTDTRKYTTAVTDYTDLTWDIAITAPTATSAYGVGDRIEIAWNTDGGTGAPGAVNLDYSVDGGATWTDIITGTMNDGAYSWLPSGISGKTVLLRAEATDLAMVLDTDLSEAFTIGTVAGDDATDEDGFTDLPAGTYVKGTSTSSVYYIDTDGTRRPFLDRQTYFTHANSFDGVVTLTDADLAHYPLGKSMLPKAGVVLVKVQSVNAVYAVTEGGVLRWIETEAVAKSLYGNNWADYVIDVPATAWKRFTIGTSVDSANDLTVNMGMMQTRTALNSK